MKKFLSLALATLMVATLGVSASAVAANTFDAAMGTPTIDGIMDDAYKAASAIKVDKAASGDGKTTAEAYVLWDDKNIYMFANVTDPVLSEEYSPSGTTYATDSFEFFFDLSGEPEGSLTSEVNAGQYTAHGPLKNAPGTWAGMGLHTTLYSEQATFATVATDNGWTVEMQIPFGNEYTPKAGAQIGVVFHINSDEDGTGDTRDGEVFASSEAQGNAWQDTNNWDKLNLTDAVYVAPVETPDAAPEAADMGIVTALVALTASGAAIVLKKRK